MSRRRVERNIAYDDVRKRYYVTLEYGKDPENGKQIRQIRTFSKITEARAALRKHEAARDMGQVVQPSSMTLDQWLSHWMDNVVSLNRAVTTVYSYRNMINRHISPALGSIPIQQLTPLRLQEYYAGLIRGKGLSSNTARKHHDLLNLALNAAVRQGIILSNPAQRVDAPKVRRPEIHYYSMEDLQRLLRLAEGTRLDILIKLAGLLGLRREEIVGLQWKHVDLTARKLEICSVRTSAGSQVITKEPKTSSSRRTLHIPDILAEALIRQKKHQEDCKAYLEDAYVDSGYVFTYEDGRPMRPNYASELFTSFIAQNHLPPLTLHGLRHSFASIASAKGIPMYDIGKALGHSSPATTSKIYTHLLDPDHKDLLDRLWDES